MLHCYSYSYAASALDRVPLTVRRSLTVLERFEGPYLIGFPLIAVLAAERGVEQGARGQPPITGSSNRYSSGGDRPVH